MIWPLVCIFLISFSFAQGQRPEKKSEIQQFIRELKETNCSEDNSAFERVTSGIAVACHSFEEKDGYELTQVVDCTGEGKTYPGGFRIRSKEGHRLMNLRSPYGPKAHPERNINIWSRNGALNETFLFLNDKAGGPDEHDVKSVIFLLPRTMVPRLEVKGEEVEILLNTGEKVTFDKKTGAIKGGALREGPNDLTTDRYRRQPPNVHYSGTGISIRLNHRYADPLLGAELAEIRQIGRSCRIPRLTLFDSSGKLRTTSDAELIKVLNHSCPPEPGQKPFRI